MSSHVVPAHPLTRTPHPVRYVHPPVLHPKLPRRSLGTWIKLHKMLTLAIVATVALAAVTVAALTLRIDTAVTPASKAAPVIFEAGDDYTAINTAGFATLTLGTSGASASLSMSGVAGAAQVSLGDVMKITNQDATQDYTVTLARSTTLNAAISSLVVTVDDGASTLVTWDPKTDATSSSFTLPANTAGSVSISVVIADGTAVGALGSFSIQVSLAPV